MKLALVLCSLAALSQISSAQTNGKFDLLGFLSGIGDLIGSVSTNLSASGSVQNFCNAEKEDVSEPVGQDISFTCRRKPTNLLFLVDSSKYADPAEFELVKQMLKNVLRNYDISQDETRVALIQFDNTAKTLFSFNKHDNLGTLQEEIERMEQSVGNPNLIAALVKARTEIDVKDGWRANRETVLITITYRGSKANIKPQMDQLDRAVGGKLKSIVVGIQPESNRNVLGNILSRFTQRQAEDAALNQKQLEELASKRDNIFVVCGFERSDRSLSQAVAQQICNEVDDTCRQSHSELIFVVERPGDLNSENMKNLKGFLRSMVASQDIGEGRTRIGLYQYIDDFRSEFPDGAPLSSRQYDVERVIDELQPIPENPRQRKNVYKVLNNVYTGLLPGRRPNTIPVRDGADVVVVVIAQSDSVISPIGMTNALRNRGATVISVGVGATTPTDKELADIDGRDPARRLRVPSYKNLDRRRRNALANIICGEKPAMRLTGGFLRHEACLTKAAGDAAFSTRVGVGFQDTSPKACYDACKAGARRTEVVAIKGKGQCFCGNRAWSSADISAGTETRNLCNQNCLTPALNPIDVKCGGAIGYSLYTVEHED